VKTAAKQLDEFIDRYSPDIAQLARQALAKLRKRLPGSTEYVFDTYSALAVGFGPRESAGSAVFSIALYPRWINFFFLRGATLPDPKGLLQGDGKVVRRIRLDDAAKLDDPDIRALMDAALARSEPIDPSGRSRILIKSVNANPRPRRTS
jgi:hypothetical protein